MLLGHVVYFELFSHLVELKVKLLHLYSHLLVVVDQSGLLLLINPDLINQILSSSPLILSLLTQRQPLICLNELPLSIDDHSLELITLPHKLLSISIDLLLELQVLLQECIPLPLAASLTPLVLFNQSS